MWFFRAISLPHLRQHKLRSLLTIVGIAAGVAAIVGSALVAQATLRSFEALIRLTAGSADIHIASGSGLSEDLIDEVIHVRGVVSASPLVQGFVRLGGPTKESIAVVGVDVFGGGPWRELLPRSAIHVPDESAFVTHVDSVAVPTAFAERLGLELGSALEVITPAGTQFLVVRGLVDMAGLSNLFGGAVLMMDWPAAQVILAKQNRLDRIDITVSSEARLDQVRADLTRIVAGRGEVSDRGTHGRHASELLFSIRIVMVLASAMAAVVAFFIIFHTVRVSVAQRRRDLGLLNALGISPALIWTWLVGEAAVLGAVASVVGIIGGLTLARVSAHMYGGLTQSWIRTPPPEPQLSAATVAWGMLLGVGLAIFASIGILARFRWTSTPVALAVESQDDRGHFRGSGVLTLVGLVGVGGALLATVIAPTKIRFVPLVTYILGVNGALLFSIGLLAPFPLMAVGASCVKAGRSWGSIALMIAGSNLERRPVAPTAVIVAIVLALGWTIAGVSLIDSVRSTWLRWMDDYYGCDVVVTAQGATVDLLTAPPLAEGFVDRLGSFPAVSELQAVQMTESRYRDRPVVIEAMDRSSRPLALVGRRDAGTAERFWDGRGVLVSDNLARLEGLEAGDDVNLQTPDGTRSFRVIGRYATLHAGDLGSFAVARATYRRLWHDDLVTRIFVWLRPGSDPRSFTSAVNQQYADSYGIQAISFREAKSAISELIDGAFASGYGLVLVAIAVSLVGIVNFLVAAVLERRVWFQILFGVGVSPGQLLSAVAIEAGLLAVVGGLLAFVAGAGVSRVLVYRAIPMVNGWAFDYVFPAVQALALVGFSVAIAVLSSLIPARMATRRDSLVSAAVRTA